MTEICAMEMSERLCSGIVFSTKCCAECLIVLLLRSFVELSSIEIRIRRFASDHRLSLPPFTLARLHRRAILSHRSRLKRLANDSAHR